MNYIDFEKLRSLTLEDFMAIKALPLLQYRGVTHRVRLPGFTAQYAGAGNVQGTFRR